MHDLTQIQHAYEDWQELKADPHHDPEGCARFCAEHVPYLLVVIELCASQLRDSAEIRRERDKLQRLIEQDLYRAGGKNIE